VPETLPDFDFFVGTLGIIAAILITSSFVPQIRKALTVRSMHDVSVYLLVLLIAGFSLWVLYGTYRGDRIIIGANIVNASLTIMLLILKIRYRKTDKYIGLR
jgi:MtN3 and saliva related transmembrane protein